MSRESFSDECEVIIDDVEYQAEYTVEFYHSPQTMEEPEERSVDVTDLKLFNAAGVDMVDDADWYNKNEGVILDTVIEDAEQKMADKAEGMADMEPPDEDRMEEEVKVKPPRFVYYGDNSGNVYDVSSAGTLEGAYRQFKKLPVKMDRGDASTAEYEKAQVRQDDRGFWEVNVDNSVEGTWLIIDLNSNNPEVQEYIKKYDIIQQANSDEQKAIENIAMNEWREVKKDFVETTDRIKDFCEYRINEWVMTPEGKQFKPEVLKVMTNWGGRAKNTLEPVEDMWGTIVNRYDILRIMDDNQEFKKGTLVEVTGDTDQESFEVESVEGGAKTWLQQDDKFEVVADDETPPEPDDYSYASGQDDYGEQNEQVKPAVEKDNCWVEDSEIIDYDSDSVQGVVQYVYALPDATDKNEDWRHFEFAYNQEYDTEDDSDDDYSWTNVWPSGKTEIKDIKEFDFDGKVIATYNQATLPPEILAKMQKVVEDIVIKWGEKRGEDIQQGYKEDYYEREYQRRQDAYDYER